MGLVESSVMFKLFDEPFANLSIEGEDELVKLIKQLFQDQQIFLISHSNEVEKYYDHRIDIVMEGKQSKVTKSWLIQDTAKQRGTA